MSKLVVNFKWFLSKTIKLQIMGCKPNTNMDLNVLHLSKNFLVVNKQCDLLVNSETPEQHPVTLATQISTMFPHLADPNVKFGFRFCHRLDYSTSGTLAVALSKEAMGESTKLFMQKKVKKYYLALVHGHIKDDRLILNKDIGCDTRIGYTHRMCTSDKDYCKDSRWAITELLVLQRGTYNGNPATKVLMRLITGRRHQLRVHCHELGHTIVGDFTYSDRKDLLPYRMFLHSYRLMMPCKMETLDIITEDPFTEADSRNLWCPMETVHDLNSELFSIV